MAALPSQPAAFERHLVRSSLSTEFLLAAACCRWPPSKEKERVVAEAAARGVDWARFDRVIRRHRIEGLAHAALRRVDLGVPDAVASNLESASAAIARDNLLQAAACLRLQKSFAEGGVPILFLKGLTLGILAYDTLSLKQSRDIDVVVPAGMLDEAFELLRRDGYRCLSPTGQPADVEAATLAKLSKETIWRKDNLLVELHSGIVDNPALLPGVGAESPRQLVLIAPGKALPTLEKDELFSYLCVHGATHAWSRLKWLADVAALISADDDAEIERLYLKSVELGAGRSSGQALLLCSQLFGTSLPSALARELGSDFGVRWLVRVAMKSMTRERELDETVLGTIPIHLSHFLLAPGGRYKLSELKRKSAGRPTAASSIPKFFGFLRPLVAIPLWLRARARERIRR